jgi:hypothetical protein
VNYYLRRRQAALYGGLPGKHPGSKKNYQHQPAGKGNTWRAMTRALRRYPGWKKRVLRLAEENGWQR